MVARYINLLFFNFIILLDYYWKDVMFGGTETMASGIEWALTELLRNPAELKRLQQELTEVVGLDQRVDDTHLEKLTFLKCTLKRNHETPPTDPAHPPRGYRGHKAPRLLCSQRLTSDDKRLRHRA